MCCHANIFYWLLVSHIVFHLVFIHQAHLLFPVCTEVWLYCRGASPKQTVHLIKAVVQEKCRSSCVHLFHMSQIPVCHGSITATHTRIWALLTIILTQELGPEGELRVWAPSNWQQEATTLITG